VHCWDGDYVVYNPLSGNTHFLDIMSGEVLEAIIAGRTTLRQLCAHMAEFLDVANDARIEESVREILTALDELGLIEPVKGC
jgi:PqqD family protein of HPr-rel-A system